MSKVNVIKERRRLVEIREGLSKASRDLKHKVSQSLEDTLEVEIDDIDGKIALLEAVEIELPKTHVAIISTANNPEFIDNKSDADKAKPSPKKKGKK